MLYYLGLPPDGSNVKCFGVWLLCNPSPVSSRWKVHEACMLALGSVKTIITENVKNGRIQFDMHGFLANVILADLNLVGESLISS